MKKPLRRIRLCLEQLEDRIVPSALPDIQMTFATTTDSQTVRVNYNITGASLAGQNLNFNIYRSASFNSLSGAQLIGTASIPGSDSADLSLGSHQGVQLALTAPNGQPLTALTPNTALPFIVVAANPGNTIAESNLANNTASFETHVLGVIVHGVELIPSLLILNTPPAWEMQMAASLQQQDGYEAVLAFNWMRLAALPFPFTPALASGMLYQQIIAQADQLASQHPGDVVDINIIGHSRGNVVVSEVMQQLAGTDDPALRGGYMQMTLLDPHPLNNLYAPLSWAQGVEAANVYAAIWFLLQTVAHDPQVVVPSNVKQVFEFDQQTPAGQLGFNYPSEILFNFQGNLPEVILNESAQPIKSKNLTGLVTPGIGLIGHFEMHDWYTMNVVETNQTFAYFA